MAKLTESQIKTIIRAEYHGLKESYPSITADYIDDIVRKLLNGEEVKGVVAMFIRKDMEDAGLL